MNNDRHIEKCDLGIEMMAYVYGEMAEADKARIDEHLLECGACTDDFAENSMSRFSVYEWKREEFDAIATPSFVVPYEPVPETASEGWLSGLRGLLAGWPATVAFASVAIVAVGAGLFGLNYLGGKEEVAIVPTVDVKPDAPVITVSAPAGPVEPEKSIASVTKATAKDPVRPPRVVEAKSVIKKADRINDGATRAGVIQENKKPRLSNPDDDDDDTLRLADLFDEGGV